MPVRIWDINICRPLAFNTGPWARLGAAEGRQAAARLSLSRKTFSYEMRFVMKVELQNGACPPGRGASHIFNIHVLQSIHTHTPAHKLACYVNSGVEVF